MNDTGNALFAICGLMCIYPLIFFAVPAFLIGRYRIKLRSPVEISDPLASDKLSKPVPRQDRIGYGSTPKQ